MHLYSLLLYCMVGVVLKAGTEREERQVNESFLQIVHRFLPLRSDSNCAEVSFLLLVGMLEIACSRFLFNAHCTKAFCNHIR